MAYKKRSKNLEVARKLPPSYHTLPGEKFEMKKSEVINWLIEQPEILNYLWNNIKNSDDVEYNAATGVWTGVEYNGD
ncbi:hypothetical protein ABFY60_15665 [Lysinibacillus pakistanensis]|uniref:hypothetical protein n=1 Tax=Lysinibacillus pakistanensis TaxID=759811 RepID=UPI003D2CC078